MSADHFDVVIVGAGIAGAVSAYIMAQAGLSVLVLERGSHAGSKNVSGGRLYAHSLEKIIPHFAERAPLQRQVTHEKLAFLTADSSITLEYHTLHTDNPQQASYTVLRSTFDHWLIGEAETAGAHFIPATPVTELVVKQGKVVGIKAGDDLIFADAVILAEGAHARLSQTLGLGIPVSPNHLALGIKEVIAFSPQQIEERFNLLPGEGTAWLMAGFPTQGLPGGGFLYTNQHSISLGIVCPLAHVTRANMPLRHQLDHFKQHPTLRRFIEGGNLQEYSAHLIPEIKYDPNIKLVGEGVLVVGDAAGFCLNLGYSIRGMDLAVMSAQAAAHTLIEAKQNGDFSVNALQAYIRHLKQNALLSTLQRYQGMPALLNNPRLFNQYPQMMATLMQQLFVINGEKPPSLLRQLHKVIQPIGLFTLLKDLIRGAKSL